MFFVSANDKQCAKGGKQHKYHKGGTHGDKFRKNAGNKLAGKGANGVKHKESAVKTPFNVVGNIGLRCGNADVIGSYAKYAYHKA